MEQLVTASVGLYRCNGKFYLQVITAEQYKGYIVEIGKLKAYAIKEENALSIVTVSAVPAEW